MALNVWTLRQGRANSIDAPSLLFGRHRCSIVVVSERAPTWIRAYWAGLVGCVSLTGHLRPQVAGRAPFSLGVGDVLVVGMRHERSETYLLYRGRVLS